MVCIRCEHVSGAYNFMSISDKLRLSVNRAPFRNSYPFSGLFWQISSRFMVAKHHAPQPPRTPKAMAACQMLISACNWVYFRSNRYAHTFRLHTPSHLVLIQGHNTNMSNTSNAYPASTLYVRAAHCHFVKYFHWPDCIRFQRMHRVVDGIECRGQNGRKNENVKNKKLRARFYLLQHRKFAMQKMAELQTSASQIALKWCEREKCESIFSVHAIKTEMRQSSEGIHSCLFILRVQENDDTFFCDTQTKWLRPSWMRWNCIDLLWRWMLV